MAIFFHKFFDLGVKFFLGSFVISGFVWGIVILVRGTIFDAVVLLTALSSNNLDYGSLGYGNVGEAAHLLNHVFPLSETFAMATAYVGLYMSFLSFRWVKSFIPTASN